MSASNSHRIVRIFSPSEMIGAFSGRFATNVAADYAVPGRGKSNARLALTEIWRTNAAKARETLTPVKAFAIRDTILIVEYHKRGGLTNEKKRRITAADACRDLA